MLFARILLLCSLATALLPAQSLDLMPDESLKGWTRIAIPATDGLKPKLQWRVDSAQKSLICTGDGQHEWLRFDQAFGDYVLEVDFRFKETSCSGTPVCAAPAKTPPSPL